MFQFMALTDRRQRQPLKWFLWWLILGWCLVLWVIYQSLTSTPLEVPSISFGDKVGHFAAYFILMAWFAQLYKRCSHHWYLFGFITMGALLELVQGQTTYRAFEYADMLANSTGALAAWWLAKQRFSKLFLSAERYFNKRNYS